MSFSSCLFYFQIVALVEEISRLRSALAALQESHNLRIQQLEERLEAKRQHISRLEARLDKQSEYDDDLKKENRYVIWQNFRFYFPWKSGQWTRYDSDAMHSNCKHISFIQNQHLNVFSGQINGYKLNQIIS